MNQPRAESVTAVKVDGAWTTSIDYHISLEPVGRRVRGHLNGVPVVDSLNALVMLEKGHLPVYYFPRADVAAECLSSTDHHTYCPHKGEASYWTVSAGSKAIENGAWAYLDPYAHLASLADLVAFYWNAMDEWWEEDEQVFVHARDPRKNVLVVDCFRPVEVLLDETVVASTRRARILHETDLPARYYIPSEDVRTDLLVASGTRTRCPYKGEAVYWNARMPQRTVDDVVWSYPRPIAECPRIASLMCFFNEVVDDILVDGVAEPKSRTKWSRD